MLQRIYKNVCLNIMYRISYIMLDFLHQITHVTFMLFNQILSESRVMFCFSTENPLETSLDSVYHEDGFSAAGHTSSIDSLLQCSFITKQIIPIQHLLLCFFSSFFLPVSLFLRAVYGSRPELLKALKSGAGTPQLGHVIVALPIFPKSQKLSELD